MDTIKIDPESIDRLARRIGQEIKLDSMTAPRLGQMESVVIDSPEGPREMWVDEIGDSHWPRAEPGRTWSAAGWRKVWVVKQ